MENEGQSADAVKQKTDNQAFVDWDDIGNSALVVIFILAAICATAFVVYDTSMRHRELNMEIMPCKPEPDAH